MLLLETMPDFLPELVLHEILVRLPPSDLIRCLCVSKAWNAFIRRQSFIKAHLQRSIETNSSRTILLESRSADWNEFVSLQFNDNDTFGDDAVRLEIPSEWGCPLNYSVHGLVCVTTSWYGGGIALWNPSIQKWKKIPDFAQQQCPTTFGFGYDLVNDDYKVLVLARYFDIYNQAKVYSYKSNSWKQILNFPSHCLPSPGCDDIVNLNGGLSWIMPSSDYYRIGTLDLATERFREILTPVRRFENDLPTLRVLGGWLCISIMYLDLRRDLWIMKEYGVTESWTLLCSIDQGAMPSEHNFYSTTSSKNGQMVLFSLQCISHPHDTLFWYDIEKKSVKPVELGGLPLHVCDPRVCVGSLCLLDGDPLPVM